MHTPRVREVGDGGVAQGHWARCMAHGMPPGLRGAAEDVAEGVSLTPTPNRVPGRRTLGGRLSVVPLRSARPS